MNKEQFDGFWNGDPAKFRVVNIIIGEEPENLKNFFETQKNRQPRYLWFVPFIGNNTQAVEIEQGENLWYIDNTDGAGVYKVLNGGTMQQAHNSIYPAAVLEPVAKHAWVQFTTERRQLFIASITEAWMKRDPEGYPVHLERVDQLRKGLEKVRGGILHQTINAKTGGTK